MIPTSSECARRACEEWTEWDWVSIVFDAKWFCSPDCAREHLQEMDRIPTKITLHEPQGHLDRDPLPGVDRDDVDLIAVVDPRTKETAFDLIDDIEEMYPGEFRVTEVEQ
jgi:hypothetical protein